MMNLRRAAQLLAEAANLDPASERAAQLVEWARAELAEWERTRSRVRR
jgi:hypothetical protein